MAELGKMNRLPVVKMSAPGAFLDGGDLGEILLPNRYVPAASQEGDNLDVFVYRDSEDRLVATTQRPLAQVGEFACLAVTSTTPIGTFLDWGLPKDLLVPFREQRVRMGEGQSYVVYLYVDPLTDRIVATSKLDKHLDTSPPTYAAGERVELLVVQRTDLGYKAIVNGAHWGVLFTNEVFTPLHRGQRIAGFIKQVREDGKIDLCLQQPGYEKVAALTDVILTYLKQQGGYMPVTDKNPPEDIYRLFGVSKKSYKMAIGALYKKRLITFEGGGTRLT